MAKKIIVGRYTTWANQYDLWKPQIPENRCVVTKFEKDNPVIGAPEIWAGNPMSPNNAGSFFREVLQREIKKDHGVANELAVAVEELYSYWNLNYTKGQSSKMLDFMKKLISNISIILTSSQKTAAWCR